MSLPAENCLAATDTISQFIDLPDAPLVITGEPGKLNYSEVEIHLMDGSISYGNIITLDQTQQLLKFQEAESREKTELYFEKLRFVLFTRELVYEYENHPAASHSATADLPEKPQSFSINFDFNICLSGDTAITVIEQKAIHVYKVKPNNKASRMFIPIGNVDNYAIGDQIGTVLKNRNELTEEGLQKGLEEQARIRTRPLGEYFKEKGIVSDEALETALKNQHKWPKVRLGELLVNEGLISELQLKEALGLQQADRGRRLGDILIDIGATTEDAVHSALAQKLGVPFVRLRDFEIAPEVVNLVPIDIAKKHMAMPIMISGNYLVVAVPDPTKIEDTRVIAFSSNRMIEVAVATPADIKWAIDEYYGNDLEPNDDLDLDAEVSQIFEPSRFDDDTEKMANDRPIVKLVQNLLIDGVKRNASDIHIRPHSRSVEVLFRIHGKLTHVRDYNKSLLPTIVARIKVMSRMDIAQRRIPQDGRVQVKIDGEIKDMRVSVIPTVEGESVVIRLLASAASLKPLDELGFSDDDTQTLDELLHRGAGLILVTGPTGSGKSTTLYSALNILRGMNLNIITAEDPVEIRLDGLEQVQVHHEIGVDFSRVLRNVLRHDPDVIMIGEIRDEETAKIAVQAAQTGHLVLSTLHTNSAADTIVRLGEMKVERYMIASGLLGVIAQRLVKLNCPDCRVPEEVSATVQQLLGVGVGELFYQGKGCDSCQGTGVTGRIPAYEFMNITQSLQQAILQDSPTVELNRLAKSWGMKSVSDCALKYARNGDTSLAEVHRIYMT